MFKNKILPPSLIYVSDMVPGYKRVRERNEFIYIDRSGKVITKKTLNRIRGLGIPPMWENVWICPKAGGHIQATGRDAKGRKQ